MAVARVERHSFTGSGEASAALILTSAASLTLTSRLALNCAQLAVMFAGDTPVIWPAENLPPLIRATSALLLLQSTRLVTSMVVPSLRVASAVKSQVSPG